MPIVRSVAALLPSSPVRSVDLERAKLVVERAREVAERVVDEADRTQRPGDRAVVLRRLEGLQRIAVGGERHFVVEQQVGAAAREVPCVGARARIALRLRDRVGLLRVPERPAGIDAGRAVRQREQQRQADFRRLRGRQVFRHALEGGRGRRRVTHARPRPGSRRTSPRAPCRSAPAT